ncbi:hypothetical protein [Phyllobacterium endophyticum]|uniref:Uncharacterized protein n=1 Tax=Phyllobacterium endophyticum TaxID=1149773 RepID=A0A2P7AZA5_9HYPH|nr:hypothetical protein [Phyllobacterium endophyticum]MBB3235854.1 hypothetical protein [Phyllobacterium endophyticum]PSH59556.1 hypothetical protein CU100_01860 [Phyllobacterium endophyticum]TYR41693.1 hypothetical protein FY050_10500 [Phyllobacterium endophyticum]
MSMDYLIHLDDISDEIIPQMISELNKFEMSCEIRPGFSFALHSGFLPFRFRLSNPGIDLLKGRDLMSGFELYVRDFHVSEAKGFSQDDLSRLSKLKKTVIIRLCPLDSFEFRFSELTSAIIAEILDAPRSLAGNVIFDSRTIVEKSWEAVKAREKSIANDDWRYHEFVGWS